MYKKIIWGVVVLLIVILVTSVLLTKDLSTYKTYDIGNDSDGIISCFDYNDTVY